MGMGIWALTSRHDRGGVAVRRRQPSWASERLLRKRREQILWGPSVEVRKIPSFFILFDHRRAIQA